MAVVVLVPAGWLSGSILAVAVDPGHHITSGLGPTADVFFQRSPAFEIQPGFGERQPIALAAYTAEQPLRSGWILGEKLLDRRAAIVEAPSGKGRAVLIGFRTQFRGQTYGTFRVLFNAIYYAGLTRTGTGQ